MDGEGEVRDPHGCLEPSVTWHFESREKFLVLYRLGNSIAVEQNGKSEEVFHASTQSSQQELKTCGLERCPGQVKAFAMQI